MSTTATLEKPETKKKSGVEIPVIPSVVSLVARMPEQPPDVPSSDANMTEAMAEKQAEKLLNDASESAKTATDNAVKLASEILDGTKLSVYVKVGDAAYDAIAASKAEIDIACSNRKAESTWTADYFDAWCAAYSHKVRVLYPGLVRPLAEQAETKKGSSNRKKADSTVRVSDWVHAAIVVRCIKPLVSQDGKADLTGLSYNVVNEHMRHMVKLSKTDLSYSVKDEWSEFIRREVPRVLRHEIEIGSFLAAIDKHEAKLTLERKLAKSVGKTPEQIAAEEVKAANDKKTQAANKLRTDVNTALSTSLTQAIGGVLSDNEVRGIVSTIEKSAGRTVLTGLPTNAEVKPVDRSEFTVDDFKSAIRALAAADKYTVINEIIAAAKRFEKMLSDNETPATLPLAAAM